MKTIQILDPEDAVQKQDFCRPLHIDARGNSCDSDGYPTNFVKWAPVSVMIPEYFHYLSVGSLREEGYNFEFARGDIPAQHKLDMRLYPTVCKKRY